MLLALTPTFHNRREEGALVPKTVTKALCPLVPPVLHADQGDIPTGLCIRNKFCLPKEENDILGRSVESTYVYL